MAVKYCYNAKTGETFSYTVEGELTDFPRGTLLAYGNYLITGIENLAGLVNVESEYGECPKCESARRFVDGKCSFCGERVIKHYSRHTNEV